MLPTKLGAMTFSGSMEQIEIYENWQRWFSHMESFHNYRF